MSRAALRGTERDRDRRDRERERGRGGMADAAPAPPAAGELPQNTQDLTVFVRHTQL